MLAIPPPTIIRSTSRERQVSIWSFVETLLPPTIAKIGLLGHEKTLSKARSSFADRRPEATRAG